MRTAGREDAVVPTRRFFCLRRVVTAAPENVASSFSMLSKSRSPVQRRPIKRQVASSIRPKSRSMPSKAVPIKRHVVFLYSP